MDRLTRSRVDVWHAGFRSYEGGAHSKTFQNVPAHDTLRDDQSVLHSDVRLEHSDHQQVSVLSIQD